MNFSWLYLDYDYIRMLRSQVPRESQVPPKSERPSVSPSFPPCVREFSTEDQGQSVINPLRAPQTSSDWSLSLAQENWEIVQDRLDWKVKVENLREIPPSNPSLS